MNLMGAKWDDHPGVTTGKDLSFSERAADVMRNGMGSWGFVFTFIFVLVGWVIVNSILGVGATGDKSSFDPYPYILLNLFLSMLAALQGGIILIAQKRADFIASEEAHHTLHNTELLKELLASNHRLTQEIHFIIHKGNGDG